MLKHPFTCFVGKAVTNPLLCRISMYGVRRWPNRPTACAQVRALLFKRLSETPLDLPGSPGPYGPHAPAPGARRGSISDSRLCSLTLVGGCDDICHLRLPDPPLPPFSRPA